MKPVLRGLAIALLSILALGFGLCAVSSLIVVTSMPAFLIVTALAGGLCCACLVGVRRLGAPRGDEVPPPPPQA